MPKSSTVRWVPWLRGARGVRWQPTRCRASSAVSVISSQRRSGSSPLRRSVRSTSPGSDGSESCRGERLTLMARGAPSVQCSRPVRGLRARRVEDPGPDRHDQTGLLGEPDEIDRAEEPALGVVPAQERLEVDDPTRLEVEDRLVVHLELTAREGAVECVAGVELLERASAHPLVEDVGARRDQHPWRGTSRCRRRARGSAASPTRDPESAIPMLVVTNTSPSVRRIGRETSASIRRASPITDSATRRRPRRGS